MSRRGITRGFTLLEVLVATAIMAIAVVSLLASLSTSMRNASRLTDHDRMALLARAKMDELLADRTLPFEGAFQGKFVPAQSNGSEAGYQVMLGMFDAPPHAVPGTPVLQRIALRVWWKSGDRQRSLDLSGFRRSEIPAS